MTKFDRGRTGVMICLIGSALALSACGTGSPSGEQSPDEDSDIAGYSPVAAEAHGAYADFTIDATADGVVIDYTVTNDGPDTVIVVDRLPPVPTLEQITADSVDPNHVIVGVVDGRARISKQVFGAASSGGSAGTPKVGGTRVSAGETHSGRVELAPEITITAPGYGGAGYTAEGIDDATELEFCLGVVPNYGDSTDPLVAVPIGHVDQQLLCSDPVPIPSTVTFVPHP
ncbi:hypothetical protein [Brevibacterium samyangense]|uniref:Uncharacterized protein n=1 Tax=Brevibacterium samyangense TaxID=366888 RepID=A0ABP5F3E7_9MICO